jgi:hypothetical protein
LGSTARQVVTPNWESSDAEPPMPPEPMQPTPDRWRIHPGPPATDIHPGASRHHGNRHLGRRTDQATETPGPSTGGQPRPTTPEHPPATDGAIARQDTATHRTARPPGHRPPAGAPGPTAPRCTHPAAPRPERIEPTPARSSTRPDPTGHLGQRIDRATEPPEHRATVEGQRTDPANRHRWTESPPDARRGQSPTRAQEPAEAILARKTGHRRKKESLWRFFESGSVRSRI